MIQAVANEKGFLLCPQCGQRTHTKVNDDTIVENFPLWCTRCKQETIIEYCQSLEPEQPKK